MDYGLIGALGEGLEKGLASYRDERKYQEEKKQKDLDQAMRDKQYKLSLFTGGAQETPEGGFIESELSKQKRMDALELKRRELDRKMRGDDLNEEFKKSQIRRNDAEIAGGGVIGGRAVPAGEAVSLGGANASYQALSDVDTLVDQNKDIMGPTQGLISKGAGFLQVGERGKRAASFDADLNARAQIIGKYLEGGKLTDSDIGRYRTMLPTGTDTPDVALSKSNTLKTLIAQKQAAEKQGLGQAGYKTGGLITSDIPMNKKTKGSSEDAQALQWAQANSKDPRAQAIMKRLGQ